MHTHARGSFIARPLTTLALLALCGLPLSAGCQHGDRVGAGAPSWVHSEPGLARWPDNPVAVIDGVQQPAPTMKMGEARVIAAILDEGKHRNEAMNHVIALTDIGPRLTGSSNLERAEQWARSQFDSWGLTTNMDEWGVITTRFDRGPSEGSVWMPEEAERPRRPRQPRPEGDAGTPATPTADSAPQPVGSASAPGEAAAAGESAEQPAPAPTWREVRSLEFTWLAWSGGTNGPVRGPVVKLPADDAAYEKAKAEGKLAGAWILLPPPPAVGQRGVRSRIQTIYDARAEARQKVAAGETTQGALPIRERVLWDGIAGFISTSRDERVWTGGFSNGRDIHMDQLPKDAHAVVRLSDYDYLNSRLNDGEPVQVELDMNATMTSGRIPQYNVIAEIRGSTKPDEFVIVSGHLDSWDGPGSRGTLDNSTGSAVTMEAARILSAALQKTGARPIRTIKFILWTGEEQGLLGSASYVRRLKEAGLLDKVSACFVDDGGTNWQGGLTPADNMVEMLAAAAAPTNNQFWSAADGKWMNVDIKHGGASVRSHGSSDHAPFNREGVPGFFWDEVGRSDYQFGWHTQNDKPNLAIPEYLAQSSTNSAIVAYNLAMAETLLPRGAKADPIPTRVRGPNLPGQPEGASPGTAPSR